MARPILTYPHEILAKKASEVDEITDEIRDLAKEMSEIMYENKGIGLAAPQVGESIRLITVDITGPELKSELFVMINPVIESLEGQCESDEGCLSLPELRTLVKRAEKATVSYMDLEGEQKTIDADEMLAVCLQHEIDHLEGTLLINRMSRLKRSLYDKKVKKWRKQAQREANE